MNDLAVRTPESGDEQPADPFTEKTEDRVKALLDLRWNDLDPDEDS
jgi:hypothetical protein